MTEDSLPPNRHLDNQSHKPGRPNEDILRASCRKPISLNLSESPFLALGFLGKISTFAPLSHADTNQQYLSRKLKGENKE